MLEVRDLVVSYGRHRALEGVGVKVGRGEICVILGANGAGKSTLLKAIAGMIRAEPGGQITMNGTPITAMKPHRIVEHGIALVPEGRGIFGDLTVAENLQLGAFARRARSNEATTLDYVYHLFPRLAERRKQVARTMSGGEQQMVAIGRALMSKPEILMLDEPSLGLSPLLAQELFRSLKEIANTGAGILLVEQNAKQSLRIAARGYLIENGLVTGENTAAALMRDPAVVNGYLGGAAARGVAPAVTLPPPMRLPLDVGAIGSLIADLAARAGRIQSAFVRSLRQGGELPSAFIGRYDPKQAGDPWTEFEPEPPRLSGAAQKVSQDARRLGGEAEALARRATERLAHQVRTTRLSAPRPSAFAHAAATNVPGSLLPSALPQSDAGRSSRSPSLIGHNSGDGTLDENSSTGGRSIADLAAQAAERSAVFVRARRLAAPQPAAFARAQKSIQAEPDAASAPRSEPVSKRSLNGAHGLIGHNSAGVDLGSETAGAELADPSIAALAARAASIHSAHVAERRKTLTSFVIPAAAAHHAPAGAEKHAGKAKAGRSNPRNPAKKKRKKHKEA